MLYGRKVSSCNDDVLTTYIEAHIDLLSRANSANVRELFDVVFDSFKALERFWYACLIYAQNDTFVDR